MSITKEITKEITTNKGKVIIMLDAIAVGLGFFIFGVVTLYIDYIIYRFLKL